jgi:GTPase SAR1 family protein
MPTLRNHQSRQRSKIMIVGDNGGGKSSALAGLLREGYEVFVQDFDDGLDPLPNILADEPEALDRLHYETLKDTVKFSGGNPTVKEPKAFSQSMKLLNKWVDSETGEDFGSIEDWGSDRVLVIDSMTFQGKAALNFTMWKNNRLGKPKRINDWGDAIERQQTVLDLITDDNIKCNVVVIAHLAHLNQQGEDDEEESVVHTSEKRYPTALGKKLPPHVGSYFNTVVQAKVKGAGASQRRVISTVPDPDVDVKVPVVKGLDKELPVDKALPKLFAQLQGK